MTAAKATPAHTPGKWYVEGTNPPRIYANNGLDIIAQCDSAKEMTKAGELANAARIVACVNACEGMLPEVLDEYANEGGMFLVFGRHMAKRDEEIFALRAEVELLREALRVCVDAMQDALEGGEFWQENFAASDLPQARAALGGQA